MTRPDLSQIVVTKIDVVTAGFCPGGLREWCRLNGITAREVHDGITAERLLATGCSLATSVVEQAVKRVEREAEDE